MFSRHGNDPTRIEVRKNVAGLAIWDKQEVEIVCKMPPCDYFKN